MREPLPLIYPKVKVTFSEIIHFLENHGISKNNIRIREYQRFIKHMDDGDVDQHYEREQIIFLWRELHEVLFVFDTILKNNIPLPSDLIKKSLEGQPLPTGNAEKDKSRNYLLELRASIYFLRLGYQIHMSSDCDIIAENKKDIYFIECKRLYSIKKVDLRITEAYEQLQKRFDDINTKKNKRGIIWADPSPIMLRDVFMYSAFSRGGAQQAVRYDLLEFSKRYITKSSQYTDKRIFSIVLQMVWPSYTGSKDGIVTGFTSFVMPLHKKIGFFNMVRTKSLFDELFKIEEA
ncbi:hypothetical protein [Thiothrix nivea]|uniref:Restriction endonuclease n=1 Tax=Thiothrix nivea (strain ATCC 35100 / DSM 5205 / JP2) TaxID=870187 RepID=A0A656HLF7_THINJ|nr:hypothetical protein [Thiothrix nivea]EIJ36954.1 hypothetical protein Thini_4479 [Thiothrix nivea DSM 5205]